MTCHYDIGAIVRAGQYGGLYRLVRRIADGASGFVFEADDFGADERVALKLFRMGVVSFEHMGPECAALQTLAHPGIVRVRSYGVTRDSLRIPYIVMPLLKGASLRTTLNEHGALPLERAIDYGIEMFFALEHAHAAGILHRDLRPSNVYLERLAATVHRLVLVDFGLSIDKTSRFLSAPTSMGHPAYAAPELFYGHKPSVATDLYAAGLVLFEMLTATHALGEPSQDWAGVHYFSVPPSLTALVPAAPPALAALVEALLSKVVHLRPASAEACAQALAAIQEDLLVPSPNPTTEDGVDSLLRHIGGPSPDEDTQVEPPSPSLLRRASGADDTDKRSPPSSRNWPVSSPPVSSR
ncbi:MAG: serine/threonine-protein kinase [Polyangiaceae bacterium]